MGHPVTMPPDPSVSPLRWPGKVRLSKSKFLSGLQCSKRLYLEIYSPELATEPDEERQAVLDMGTEVGVLARQRFPGGVLVEADHRHPTDALRRTAELMADPTVPAIFEGAVESDQVLVRVDILERMRTDRGRSGEGGDAWRLIEVKSSTKVKDVHLEDLAVQSYVLQGAGVPPASVWLMHVNTQYLYPGGELDLAHLFTLRDLTEEVIGRQAGVPARLAEMRATLVAPSPPPIEPGGQCHAPYDCPFWDHCVKDKPARWVYHLPGGERAVQPLVKMGIRTIDEIPPGFRLTVLQRRVKENVEWVSRRLRDALQAVRYPVHHVDFETVMTPIPPFPKTRPYQALPTQWSNHVEAEDGSIRHDEYLSTGDKDPREEFAVTLLESVGHEGRICVYSAYERALLESLAEALPALKWELGLVLSRLWDLLPVIREHYYHPDFNGSFSLKSVLPALVPSLDYTDLEIKEGGMAARQYYRMVFEETDWVEKARIREALLKYCERDTLALLAVRKALHGKALRGAACEESAGQR